MVKLRPAERTPSVGVGIDVDHAYWRVRCRQGAKDRVGHRVIATSSQGHCTCIDDASDERLDVIVCLGDVVHVAETDVSYIGDRTELEGVDPRCMVDGTHE